ncbi:MAG TPA: TRAM domain-containing protein, partial [Stellaceae bacterium]|nr:TRAM domain-containing protein [Stellaceae bacterium]
MSKPRTASEEMTLVVESVGARGDGVARRDGRTVYIPFTAPGDRVRVRLGASRGEGRTGELVELLEAGERATPVCPHFGSCGGCALQHLAPDAYARAKEQQVAAALRQHGLDTTVIAPLLRLVPGTRRRARFAIERPRSPKAVPFIGFNARASHRVVDMRVCAVLHPALVALVPPLRAVASLLWQPGASGAATATLCDAGLDVLLDLAAAPDLAALETLAEFAAAADLARLAWRAPGCDAATPAAVRRPPRAVFSGVPVDLPFDPFLQASAEAETALTAEVLEGVGTARRVADLYAGLGTFTFALVQRAAVHAVEGARPAATALAAAAARAGLGGRVSSELRDLEARPLMAGELAGFDAVVFDPPRAGARAQSAALAAAPVPRV